MQRLIRALLSALLFCLVLGQPVAAQVEQPVSEVALEYEFGTSLQLSAHIVQPADFSSFLLVLQPDGQSSRQVPFSPDASGQVEIDYDLILDPLKPFARVYYWFELTRADGTAYTSASYWFDYTDNRYTWKTSETQLFAISWVEGDAVFGQKLQEIARSGLQAATTLLPVAPELPIRIFVYPKVEDLQGALTLTGQTWTAGHASPEIGVIVVSNTASDAELIEMERQIPHELMHILEYQVAGESYASIPTWLSEGLSTSVELYPDPDLQRTLEESHANGSLLAIDSLCAGFPQDARDAQLAYAQSASFVSYLSGTYGSDVFLRLLESSASGQTCENAVSSVLNVSLDQLEAQWLSSVFPDSDSNPAADKLLPYLIAGGVLLLAVLIYLSRKRHSQGNQKNER